VLRKEEHASKLGSRLRQVLKIDMSFPNYFRVRILFPLANAMVPSTKIHIWGRSGMVVLVWYENVPFFCFICGRIGHSDKECFEGEVGEGEFSYGVELRASPPQWRREVKVHAKTTDAHFLNFEGAQRAKLQDEASWSGSARAHGGMRHASRSVGEDHVENPLSNLEEWELMRGVQDDKTWMPKKMTQLG
jgi:hypothetical protein